MRTYSCGDGILRQVRAVILTIRIRTGSYWNNEEKVYRSLPCVSRIHTPRLTSWHLRCVGWTGQDRCFVPALQPSCRGGVFLDSAEHPVLGEINTERTQRSAGDRRDHLPSRGHDGLLVIDGRPAGGGRYFDQPPAAAAVHLDQVLAQRHLLPSGPVEEHSA